MYKCSKCGLGVIVVPGGDNIKACKCDATVVCDMVATAKGKGVIKN